MSGAPSGVRLLSGGQLLGREREREALDRLLDGGHARRGGVLVVHGEPGIGKTALLEYAVETGRGGNRKLNHAMHLIAVTQIRHDTPGRVYFERKVAEGKTNKEALRGLKRRISDAVWHQLQIDIATRS
jgi:AAA ATPase domain